MRATEDKCGRDMPQESAPEESDSQKILAAAPSNESYLTIDTCAGGSVFPRGFDPLRRAMSDTSLAPVHLTTAKDVPVARSHFGFERRPEVAIRYNEAEVKVLRVRTKNPVLIGADLRGSCKTRRLPNWRCTQLYTGNLDLLVSQETVRHCVQTTREAALASEAPEITAPEPDAPMRLDESEVGRRSKHKPLPLNVSEHEYNAHFLTDLSFRFWCGHCVRGNATDDAHRSCVDTATTHLKSSMD